MIDILIPTYHRGEKLRELHHNITDTTTESFMVYYIAETGDTTLPDINTWEKCLAMRGEYGSPSKAVNKAFKASRNPYFIFANDDFKFTPEWDAKALEKMSDGVSVVAINDGDPRGTPQWGTITLSRRSYVNDYGGTEKKGEVFHEGYIHNYVDTEYWHRAEARGVTAIAPDAVIIHQHPAFGFKADDTHRKQGDSMAHDSALFSVRRRQWL